MTLLFRMTAVAIVLGGLAAAPAQAQGRAGTPTASAAPDQDAAETAAPRRRPVPRSQARPTVRTRPAPRTRSDTINAPVRPVSIRGSIRPMATASATLRAARLDASLRDAAPEWLGIPYRWGGTTRRGIDCSAFVQQFVRQQLGLELSRTTATQQHEGVAIDRSELRAGDLVFFRRRSVRHVGVYLSEGDFIHASSSRGVTISTLDSGYWDRYYWKSRRILTERTAPIRVPRGVRRDSAGVIG